VIQKNHGFQGCQNGSFIAFFFPYFYVEKEKEREK
jgi:hypothetical protein